MTDTSELVRLYRRIDREAAPVLERLGVTCRPGCAHCCRKLTVIGLAEGIHLATVLKRRPGWRRRWLPRLRRSALFAASRAWSDESYFEAQHACPLLDARERCSVYEARPSCCRAHFVVTPPAMCDPAYKGDDVGTVDPIPMQAPVMRATAPMHAAAFGSPVAGYAPIAIVVLYCLRRLLPDDPDIARACEGVPAPDAWERG